jgi:hypothetical protein
MLIPNHPDEERLSALASHDTDATADRSLTDHVGSCARCTDLVDDLVALRASLAALPDLAPSRPLQIVPAAEGGSQAGDRAGGWARRLFAPVLVAGGTLAFVGLVGTALPAFGGMAASGAAPLSGGGAQPAASVAEQAAGGGTEAQPSQDTTRGLSGDASAPAGEEPVASATANFFGAQDGSEKSDVTANVERSIFPMLLFAGIALLIGAFLMRWILAPRAG